MKSIRRRRRRRCCCRQTKRALHNFCATQIKSTMTKIKLRKLGWHCCKWKLRRSMDHIAHFICAKCSPSFHHNILRIECRVNIELLFLQAISTTIQCDFSFVFVSFFFCSFFGVVFISLFCFALLVFFSRWFWHEPKKELVLKILFIC